MMQIYAFPLLSKRDLATELEMRNINHERIQFH